MHPKHHSLRHYQEKHFSAIEDAKSYDDLKEIALEILKDMPQPIGEVCGPASTGGHGSLQKNLEIIEKTTHKLADQGEHIFNWLPFESRFQALKSSHGKDDHEKNQFLLDRFFLHIFNSGFVKKAFFINGWQSSHGASWERMQAERLGIEIVDLPADFLER